MVLALDRGHCLALLAVIIVGAILFLARREQRRARLRPRFGPEYERTVEDADTRGHA